MPLTLPDRYTTDKLLKLTLERFFSDMLFLATANVRGYLPYRVVAGDPDIEALYGKRFVGMFPPSSDDFDDPEYIFAVPRMTVGRYVRAELEDYKMAGVIARLLGRLREGLRGRGLPAADWGDEMLWAYFTVFHEMGHMAAFERRGLDDREIDERSAADLRLENEVFERAKAEARYGTQGYYLRVAELYRALPAEAEADAWALAALPAFFADPAAFAFDAVAIEG